MRGVTAASMRVSSRFSVSGRMSTKTGTAPRSTNALAVETNVGFGLDGFQVAIGGLREAFRIDDPAFYWRHRRSGK